MSDELTAAQVIYELHQEVERLKDDLHQEGLRIEEYRDKEDEHQRQIHAREQAYNQCENYLHGSEYALAEAQRQCAVLEAECQEYGSIVANKDAEIARLKTVRELQINAIDRLNEQVNVSLQNEKANDLAWQAKVKELEDNPPIILDSASAGIITDLQEQVKRLSMDNESLRYKLRTVRDAVVVAAKNV